MTTGKITIGKVSLTPQPNPIKKEANNKFLIHLKLIFLMF